MDELKLKEGKSLETVFNKIEAHDKTDRLILDKTKYTIDIFSERI